tara:strand:- start:1338 stop:1853 length:516 start_codon:yes stop_codon:yes gene_type:complete
MSLGKIKIIKVVLVIFFCNFKVIAEDKILTVPLVNLENLEPSYEEVEIEDSNKEINQESKIKKKNKKKLKTQRASINILGLDKITAKTTEISIKLGETKKFGLLQIKAIKCGKINSKNEPGVAAYIQVKDLSDNQNEKVFVFNGWTFSSSPSLRPIDHPIYDLWLVSCENV